MMPKRVLIVSMLVTATVCVAVAAQGPEPHDGGRIASEEVRSRMLEEPYCLTAPVVPWRLNYQGYLTDEAGSAITDTLSLRFSIWDDDSLGMELWNETQDVPVEDGIFNCILGLFNPVPWPVFQTGETRWLELRIGIQTLTPRTEVTSVAYAYRSVTSDTADYAVMPTDNDWTVSGDLLHPAANYGICMRATNIANGVNEETHVNLGIACTTGVSGQDYTNCTVSGGALNSAKANHATVCGGFANTAGDSGATVGGGNQNRASGPLSTVSGGLDNVASNEFTTIGGGRWHDASGWSTTISGGSQNTASYDGATVGGGSNNIASQLHATVAGGGSNTASSYNATVGGGAGNIASGPHATVAGGTGNDATTGSATVGGGAWNAAGGASSTVGGGSYNQIQGGSATIGGGYLNRVIGTYATVSGGYGNYVNGHASAVPGGYADTVSGDYSLAAGDRVKISGTASYTFAFGRNFTTTTPNAVVFHNSSDPIRVGIGVVDPVNYIEVAGGANCDGTQWNNASSMEYKRDVESLSLEECREILAALAQTDIVRFRYKAQKNNEIHIGVIAESAPKELVDEERKTVPTGDAIGFLLAAVKAQQAEIESLRRKLEDLRN
jgi:hypothetical protein